ncbi:hypothetical protein [Streptomyces sp. UNOC14_S4]|uniref:hypothetical protein n=1 Tax=Streptomyces sp. UNOC14_S4 TaxID=2872340 RepID=UPI001E3DF84F|nr:hypothetical protein [Streptomyces sp. UNOC14_S4]MCC3770817.1 hypothetical protein [Streptomyces sp. UNOC14_S4]
MSSRADFAAAADDLAVRVLSALRGAGGTALVAGHVDSAPDALAALAAIRVIGADTFSPYVLAGATFHAEDAAAVTRSFEAFPLPSTDPTAPTDEHTSAWRDWATAQLLARVGGAAAAQRGEATQYGEAARYGEATGHALAAQPEGDAALADTADWQRWSVRMAQLATLAQPGLDGPVHEAARGAALPLSRGVTRCVLRRDFPTAVRLIRWLAWLDHEGVALPLDPLLALEHVRLLGGESPRMALDLTVARRLLEGRLPEATQAQEART